MIVNSKTTNKEFKKRLIFSLNSNWKFKRYNFRAIETLKRSDFILCEDTRISKNLLNKYEIESDLIANHKFNEKKNVIKNYKLY